jgi:hypothetical protein
MIRCIDFCLRIEMANTRASLLWMILLIAAGARADDRGVATRYGNVDTRTMRGDTDRSDIRFRGTPVTRVEGDVSLYKLTSDARSDFVLADAWVPGLHCQHQFTLMEIRADGTTVVSPQFGDCKTLLGARMQDGQAVVQLEKPYIEERPKQRRIHEFVFAGGRITELSRTLTLCEAHARSAASASIQTPQGFPHIHQCPP